MMRNNIQFLAETALLTHGLTTISNEELLQQFPGDFDGLVWVEQGEIRTGNIVSYLSVRDRGAEFKRIDGNSLEEACQTGLSGALTASGAMAVAAKLGVPLVVTAGMGGIDLINPERVSHDLAALASLPVSLIATAPKDMLDLAASVNWLRTHGVKVLGNGGDVCDGFVFLREQVKLSGRYSGTIPAKGGSLVLNPIPLELRIGEQEILRQAIARGEEARQAGQLFHPAVNKCLDELTGGRSGQLQLQSFISNIELALASEIKE